MSICKFTKKIILILLFVVSVFSLYGFAADDCISASTGFSPSGSLYLNSTDVNIAKQHLLAYCCVENKKYFEKAFSGAFRDGGVCYDLESGPESPYFFDHLVDVGIRKIQAKKQEMYKDMTGDTQGVAWNTFIEKSVVVEDEYKKNWTLNHIPPLKNEIEEDEDKKSVYNKLKSVYEPNLDYYSDFDLGVMPFSLADKYFNLCFVAYYVYDPTLSNVKIIKDGYYDKCMDLVKRKVASETSQAEQMLRYSALGFLNDSFKSYTDQFSQAWLLPLQNKIFAISSLFDTLSKQAPLTKACAK